MEPVTWNVTIERHATETDFGDHVTYYVLLERTLIENGHFLADQYGDKAALARAEARADEVCALFSRHGNSVRVRYTNTKTPTRASGDMTRIKSALALFVAPAVVSLSLFSSACTRPAPAQPRTIYQPWCDCDITVEVIEGEIQIIDVDGD